jgi:hypothetical protein
LLFASEHTEKLKVWFISCLVLLEQKTEARAEALH